LISFCRHLLLAALGVACAVSAALAQPTPEFEARLRTFEREQGIQAWPTLGMCGYDRPLQGLVWGTVLNVRVFEQQGPAAWTALANPAYRCHGVLGHSLMNWPAHLPSGRYLVAVRAADDREGERPWTLQVLAVPPADEAPAWLEWVVRRIDSGLDAQKTKP
jgi:hypothetical protein